LLIGFGGLILLELPLSVLQETTQSHVQIGTLLGPALASDPASASGAAVVFGPAGARWQRAMGSFPHPNVLGGFVAVALVLTLPYFENVGRNRLVGLLVMWSAGWAELIFSFSRAALVAAVVGCGVWLIGRRARPTRRLAPAWLVIVPIAALALGGVVAGPFLVPRLAPNANTLSTTPISGRLMLAQVALSLIRAHPLVGVGAGNFTLAELAPPFDAIAVDPVHVVPLLVAAEAGLPAALAWLTIVLGGPVTDWRRRGKVGGGSTAWFALPVAMLALALLDHYLWTLPSGRLVFWLGLGIWAATGAEEPFSGSDRSMAKVSSRSVPGAVAGGSAYDGVRR
jgi:O-antigen ligase